MVDLLLFSYSHRRAEMSVVRSDHGRQEDQEISSTYSATMSGPPVGNGSYPTPNPTQHNGHHYATGQPVHPGPYGMNQQQGFAPSPSSTFGQGVSNTASDPSVREVLGVYPFMQYTPSARGKCAFP